MRSRYVERPCRLMSSKIPASNHRRAIIKRGSAGLDTKDRTGRGSTPAPWHARRLRRFAVALTIALLAAPSVAGAATLPAGFAESLVANGLASPTAMAFAPDGRLFVCEQGGHLRVIKNGTLLPTPFVDLTAIVDSTGERGLLGVAFDPDFATNGSVYVYYTVEGTPAHNRVSRFTATGDVAAAGSEVVILELNDLSSATNHNGGAMHFGSDGKLYIAVGENANSSNSQTLANLLGKILRINPDGTIPPDNPFLGTATGQNRAIWALGLRNPFTFAIQPGTGRTFINDVGQSAWEEINDGQAGANYGWPATEGYTSDPSYDSPLYAYANDASTCAITGGTFYNPPVAPFPPGYAGQYFFADYCGGWIRRIGPGDNTMVTGFATGLSFPVDLQVSADGSLYYLARGDGAIFRVQYTAGQAPTIVTHPSSQTVPVGGTATFTVTASGTAPLGYQWQWNGTAIPDATAPTYTLSSVAPPDSGASFRCVVSNPFGSATSNPATLTVTENRAPTATITSPTAGTLYTAGTTISYAGTGSDPEDEALPDSAFAWRVDFHHDTHLHPFIPLTSGTRSGSFTIPTTGETSANVWYRVHLAVTDSQGLLHSTFRDVRPRTATLQIATDPAGLQITLDGQPRTAPVSVVSVAGVIRTLGTVSPQTVGDLTYRFTSWSDGGASTHPIATPETDTTYVQFLAYTPTVTPPAAPILTLQLNQTAFRPGETMILTATLVPGPTAALVDAYVAVRLSDGRVLSLQADGSLVPGIVPLAAGFLPFSLTGDIFRWTFGGEEPVGPHTWFTALTEAGTPHVIGDVDTDPFTFSP